MEVRHDVGAKDDRIPPVASTPTALTSTDWFCCPRCKERLEIVERKLSTKYPWLVKCDDCEIAFPGSTPEIAAQNLHKWERLEQQNA